MKTGVLIGLLVSASFVIVAAAQPKPAAADVKIDIDHLALQSGDRRLQGICNPMLEFLKQQPLPFVCFSKPLG